jgi:membrane fusion protein, multidrug efflux system
MAAPPVEVSVVELASADVTLSSELTGRTRPTLLSEVRPQVSGVLKARLFEEGQTVKAGQALYQIDPSMYRAARDQAGAALHSAIAAADTARAKAARYAVLTDMNAVSQQDVDDVRAAAGQTIAAVEGARAALQTAQLNLGYTRISAPISRRIGRSSVTPGALVTASQQAALATIQQQDPLLIDITQSSSRVLELRRALASGGALAASTEATLELDDGKLYEHTCKIEFAEASVDPGTGTVTLRARLPNPDGLLLPGMFVRVLVPEAVLPSAVLAPQQGISRDAKGRAIALVLDADNVVAQRIVTAERAIGNNWLISQGLSQGDRLIVEGTGKAKVGSRVMPVSGLTSRKD